MGFCSVLNREIGSLNSLIGSPGVKLLEDRKRANLNVNSQGFPSQTSLGF